MKVSSAASFGVSPGVPLRLFSSDAVAKSDANYRGRETMLPSVPRRVTG